MDGAVEGRWMLSRTKHGGANATPCLTEERYCASGTVWRGLCDGLGCPECVQCTPKTAQVIAETAGWLHARTATLQISWLERSMEGADAAPRFLEGLSEAMWQSFYDRLKEGFQNWPRGGQGCLWQTGVDGCASEPRCVKYHGCHEAWRGLMLRFGLLMCVCLFFFVRALPFAFGSAGLTLFFTQADEQLEASRSRFVFDRFLLCS